MMFAATYTSSGSPRVQFYFAPFLFGLIPLLLGLWEVSTWEEFHSGTLRHVLPFDLFPAFSAFGFSFSFLNGSAIATTLATLAIMGVIFHTCGDAALNVLDSFLQLFFTPPSSGSFFTRVVERRANGRSYGRDKKAERFDKVAEALQKMETQVFEDRETLKKLSAKELWARCPKHLVRKRGIEKGELIDKILETHDSSSESCAICCSDYENGDVQRKLPCGHKFHIECVDQWILKSANDYSKTPACPLCNLPLV